MTEQQEFVTQKGRILGRGTFALTTIKQCFEQVCNGRADHQGEHTSAIVLI